MRINNINTLNNNINFRGPLDSIVTNVLRSCDMNEMVNAVGLDIGAMVIPRAYYDTKARNQYAGAETFIREISGTFINCLASGLFAMGISKIASKNIMTDVKINPNTWFTKESLDTLHAAWEGDTKRYVTTVLDNLSGRDNFNMNEFKNINWNKIEWIDEEKWNKINWKNSKYKNVHTKLKTKEGFVNIMQDLIEDKNLHKDDKKNVLSILEKRLTNALGAERDIELNIKGHKLNSKLENILRDIHDMGKDVLAKNNTEKILQKITKVNKIKTFGAISGACILGLTNQYINRKITEKRTGKKGFVGDIDFTSENRRTQKKDNLLMLKKIAASALMVGMVFSVMKVKNFKDFAKKLEFSGPVTSGNAIKTVYASNIVGRFMAADNGTELRESMTRDYLGFFNWLVLGGFVAKGVASLLDKKGELLFNYSKKGKGIKHWLNDITLKTHNEIAAKGEKFAKQNIRKLNFAHACGIGYSAITLGLLLPMLNAKITKKRQMKENLT